IIGLCALALAIAGPALASARPRLLSSNFSVPTQRSHDRARSVLLRGNEVIYGSVAVGELDHRRSTRVVRASPLPAAHNEPSKRDAASTISATPAAVTDEVSEPLHYVRLV